MRALRTQVSSQSILSSYAFKAWLFETGGCRMEGLAEDLMSISLKMSHKANVSTIGAAQLGQKLGYRAISPVVCSPRGAKSEELSEHEIMSTRTPWKACRRTFGQGSDLLEGSFCVTPRNQDFHRADKSQGLQPGQSGRGKWSPARTASLLAADVCGTFHRGPQPAEYWCKRGARHHRGGLSSGRSHG